jgi:hypothetical protein
MLDDITERLPEATDETTEVHGSPGAPVEPSETHAAIELDTADEVRPLDLLALFRALASRLARLL